MNLIKEKINEIIKGRTCKNWSKQKILLKDGESVKQPTVSLKRLFTTIVIHAYKGIEVATFYVPGAYLHAYMPMEKKID